MDIGGAYAADRAAALSGVPKSTVHYWARNGHLIPSVAQKPRLWSFTDLLALRTIYWLRQPKQAFDIGVPATSMPLVRWRTLDLILMNISLPGIPLFRVNHDWL